MSLFIRRFSSSSTAWPKPIPAKNTRSYRQVQIDLKTKCLRVGLKMFSNFFLYCYIMQCVKYIERKKRLVKDVEELGPLIQHDINSFCYILEQISIHFLNITAITRSKNNLFNLQIL